MAKNQPTAPMLETLRELLRVVFRLREEGTWQTKKARALGYADGYMQALIDAGLAEERALLGLVAEERARVSGPGSAELAPPGAELTSHEDERRAVA